MPRARHACTDVPLNLSHAARFNSFLGGPYYHGWYGYNGTPRTALTLVVVVDFDTAVVDNNRAGRGGVSPQALTVLRTRGVAVNNDNNPITAVFAPPAKPLANNTALPPAFALAPAGAAAQPPSGDSNSSAPPPASADAPAANSSTARAPGSPDAPAPASLNAPAPTSPNAPAPSDGSSAAPPTTAGPVRGALARSSRQAGSGRHRSALSPAAPCVAACAGPRRMGAAPRIAAGMLRTCLLLQASCCRMRIRRAPELPPRAHAVAIAVLQPVGRVAGADAHRLSGPDGYARAILVGRQHLGAHARVGRLGLRRPGAHADGLAVRGPAEHPGAHAAEILLPLSGSS